MTSRINPRSINFQKVMDHEPLLGAKNLTLFTPVVSEQMQLESI